MKLTSSICICGMRQKYNYVGTADNSCVLNTTTTLAFGKIGMPLDDQSAIYSFYGCTDVDTICDVTTEPKMSNSRASEFGEIQVSLKTI